MVILIKKSLVNQRNMETQNIFNPLQTLTSRRFTVLEQSVDLIPND